MLHPHSLVISYLYLTPSAPLSAAPFPLTPQTLHLHVENCDTVFCTHQCHSNSSQSSHNSAPSMKSYRVIRTHLQYLTTSLEVFSCDILLPFILYILQQSVVSLVLSLTQKFLLIFSYSGFIPPDCQLASSFLTLSRCLRSQAFLSCSISAAPSFDVWLSLGVNVSPVYVSAGAMALICSPGANAVLSCF